MISRNIYINIIIRVLLIVISSVFIGWLLHQKNSQVLLFIIAVVLLVSVTNLIRYMNMTNRKLSNFFDSVKNEDSMLSFSMGPKNRTTIDLEQSLMRLNRDIQQLKIESRQQEQYYMAILEHAATGIVVVNSKGFIMHANSAARKFCNVDVLTHVKQLQRVNSKLYRAMKEIMPFEKRMVSMPSERGIIELSLKALLFKTQTDNLHIISIQDIKNELDEKELDSWLKLIRVLMHEIMNSIAPITSLSESLEKIYTVDGRQISPDEVNERIIATTVRGLDVIKEQGNGLMSFVESYRKLTRLPKPERKLIKIADFLERLKVIFNSFENSENAKIHISVRPAYLEIFADENQLSQLLINLVKNALQAGKDNPDIKIIIIAHINSENRPEIFVIDNGPGISAEIMDQIFVPFFTTKEDGSGIGLSISRQIMRLHNGTLTVTSKPGRTIFKTRW